MNRKLTEQETNLTKKGIETKLTELEDAMRNLKVVLKYKDFVQIKREYDDFARPINREAEDKDLKLKIKMFEEEARQATHAIEEMKKHLKNGVEIKKDGKKPIGVE